MAETKNGGSYLVYATKRSSIHMTLQLYLLTQINLTLLTDSLPVYRITVHLPDAPKKEDLKDHCLYCHVVKESDEESFTTRLYKIAD